MEMVYSSNEVGVTRLELIGLWTEKDTPWIHPNRLVRPNWHGDERSPIINYLSSGKILREYFGFSFCRFNCGVQNSEMGNKCLTDGKWAWPDGLAHYVSKHDVFLPELVIDAMRQNRFSVPNNLDIPLLFELDLSVEFWFNWCNLQPPA